MCPHFILFGTEKRLPCLFLLTEPRPLYKLDDCVRTRVADFQRSHRYVHDQFTTSHSDVLRKEHQRTAPHEISVGDIVFRRIYDRLYKLDSGFDELFPVIE